MEKGLVVIGRFNTQYQVNSVFVSSLRRSITTTVCVAAKIPGTCGEASNKASAAPAEQSTRSFEYVRNQPYVLCNFASTVPCAYACLQLARIGAWTCFVAGTVEGGVPKVVDAGEAIHRAEVRQHFVQEPIER